jgi:hypothetical protein
MLVDFGLLSICLDPLSVLLRIAIFYFLDVILDGLDDFVGELLLKFLGGIIVPEPIGAFSTIGS